MKLKETENFVKKSVLSKQIQKAFADLATTILKTLQKEPFFQKQRKERIEYRETVVTLLTEILKELKSKNENLTKDKID